MAFPVSSSSACLLRFLACDQGSVTLDWVALTGGLSLLSVVLLQGIPTTASETMQAAMSAAAPAAWSAGGGGSDGHRGARHRRPDRAGAAGGQWSDAADRRFAEAGADLFRRD
ncbi:hypothetical protein LNKW23_26660 [Paralimibaculum aggregatum]|uniref:Uncharacterized protein n=1 Tax=Paralimibaculum aggregatum TaxID=3036245 RepID=A0ABQ6LQM9_9RHOB|nr:hypothetical protein [Limibaculum sp. NKW23]GMG83453.1 hypothetical protein LNKW23_26660 [Limibaculum sp. NKW23]